MSALLPIIIALLVVKLIFWVCYAVYRCNRANNHQAPYGYGTNHGHASYHHVAVQQTSVSAYQSVPRQPPKCEDIA
ncbi:hypothetical protein PROFUN_07870 [Planoprotostelium fungivorum]|uniref:Uncharacterized protein n=1 Tax=Planoprotostelium fungivorum TaxID=1890364 RepID=A0A2P6NKY3_9EUKA|nr:hypothetical protein PROFUN_07870 [Planoprotostelium fungivorum]